MFFKKKKEQKEEIEKNELNLDQKIEAILFFKGEEVSLNNLSKILEIKKGKIKDAILILKERLKNSGIFLIENDNKYLLTTKPEASEIIEKIKTKDEYGELSPSAIETLSIILYKNGATRADLDLIRGVNSSYILRNLLIRGLIEKKNENGSLKYLPTLDLMSFLGISNIEEMPAFQKIKESLEKIEIQNKEENQENTEVVEKND